MRKKLLSLALALVMCLGLTVPALAADYTEVVPCKYKEVGDFSEGLAAVAIQVGTQKNGSAVVRWGFIDKTGKEIIPCQYRYTSSRFKGDRYEVGPSFSEGLAAVQDENGKWGYIDQTGKVVIPFQYTLAWNFSEGLAGVYLNGKWGFIDKTEKVVIPYQYDEARSFFEGLAMVRVGSAEIKYGFIDKTGKEVIPRQYNRARDFSEGFAAVRDENSKWGFIDKTGKEVIPCQYITVGDFSEGLAWVYDENGEKNFIDRTGKVGISYQYKNAYSFFEGLAMVSNENSKWGFIDKTGKVVIPYQYNAVGSTVNGFSEGFAVVNLAGKYGYIDKTGRQVVPCQYVSARPFSEGMAAVAVLDGGYGVNHFKWGFISVSGAQPTVPTVGGFTDVKTGDYFADPVLWAVEKGITSGTSKTTFSPNSECSVAQILTFLWRANGSPKPTTANPFSDVKSGDYYAEAAVWAYEKGMVSGSTFGGNTPCTRSMAVTYMWKAAGSPAASYDGKFGDVPANADYAQAVAWALANGVTSGTSATTFGPASTCSRCQIMTFLYRAFAK